MTPMLTDRFWSKVNKTDTCWLWIGAIGRDGYGRFRVGDKSVLAHRFAYEQLVGPIPDGLDLDHVKARGCVNRHCVNPAHLEPVTRQINLNRGRNYERERTHCPQGHEYTGGNLIVFADGFRRCSACRTAYKILTARRRASGRV